MKTQKITFILLLITLTFFTSCTDNNTGTEIPAKETNNSKLEKNNTKWVEVGAIVNGVPVVTGNKTALIANWNETLSEKSGIRGNFTDVYIIQDGEDYQLVFEGANYKSSFYVRSFSSSLMAAGDTSCTTSDCSSERLGCVVKYDQGEPGYCSPCGNGGTCTKTTSNVAMLSYNLRAS
jgi:hypothetical protein